MGEFLLIHWWPHKGSVMRKVFPCHYVFIIPILCPLMSQIGCNSLPDDFSQKKIILFHSYLEMRQDVDTPDHTDSALLRILVSGSEFIHLWARRPDWEVSACMEDEKDRKPGWIWTHGWVNKSKYVLNQSARKTSRTFVPNGHRYFWFPHIHTKKISTQN